MRWSAEFMLSAVLAAQFPKASVPEIAFLGRSNVGKSSLLNALVGAKAAKVSSTPGRTRAINFFEVSGERRAPKMIFADLPGYGYAKISKSISAQWPGFVEPYLAARETLALCICIVDANVPARPNDRQLLGWLRSVDRELLVVATKVDRLSGNERTRNLAALKRGLEFEEIVPVSARTGYGIRSCGGELERQGPRDQGTSE
jgi:GTP-binding protein